MSALVLTVLLGLFPTAHAEVLAVGTEPLGSGDDRVGKRLEERVRRDVGAFLGCRRGPFEGIEPYRYVGLVATFRLDGTIRKVKVIESTGSETVDACVSTLLLGLSVDPPPTHPDRMNVAITWIDPDALPAP